MAKPTQTTPVVGGVDTHKDLHVAAVVDQSDRVLGTQSFATTRQGYKLMLAWMRSFRVLSQTFGIFRLLADFASCFSNKQATGCIGCRLISREPIILRA